VRGTAASSSAATGSSGRCFEQEHARLGEKGQQEWLSGERFLTGCKRRESCAAGEGVAPVAEFSLLRQVRRPPHLFDVLFEPS
jgi:hypothetical protein